MTINNAKMIVGLTLGVFDDHVGTVAVFVGNVLDALSLAVRSNVLVGASDCIDFVLLSFGVQGDGSGLFALLQVVLFVPRKIKFKKMIFYQKIKAF